MRDMLKVQELMNICLDQRDKELHQLCSQSHVRGTAWYSLATRGLVIGGEVGGGVGRMVYCNSYSDDQYDCSY